MKKIFILMLIILILAGCTQKKDVSKLPKLEIKTNLVDVEQRYKVQKTRNIK